MVLDLKNLFNSSKDNINIDTVVNLPELFYSTYNPIKDGVKVGGRAYSKADVVYLDLTAIFTFDGFCDRCADSIKKQMEVKINKIVVESVENDNDSDDYIVTSDYKIDIDALIEEEVVLFLPSKMLCSDDCKGLCYQCGANLNREKCDCKPAVDPRMEALLQLLDN